MGKMNLSETEREELMSMQRSRTMAVGQVRRARLILLLFEGASRAAIMAELLRFAIHHNVANAFHQ
ncbi:6-phosphogluconolactonase/glucosamine-6-phosphate isomerase/deaminase [Paraburkholderia youngii]